MTSPIPSIEVASSTTKLPRKYDVLINFNGEDIRRKFVSHLDSVLSAVGLTTFLHHDNGVKPMHEPILNLCRVAIVVFTQTYSQSAWCLHQLQQIIQWHQTYCKHVLPVYYEIQPSDIRLQKGDFGKAFETTAHQTFSAQELEHGMSRWSHALTKAANFFGWDESNHRSDAELVDKIVKSVLNLPVMSATKFPVGLQSNVEDLIRTIKDKSSEVCIVGITGAGGSGKTTLAKAIYNQIHDTFREKSFIEDIGQVSRPRGHRGLQEQFLFDVLKTKVEITSVDMGRRMIRERLTGRRVFLVLDDLTENFTLFDLWECREWFSGGTVIIITTRDVDLPRILKVDSVFGIKLMSAKESLELLSWHAFREPKPKEEYNDLAESVVTHCGGLPLALEVVGNCLFERTKKEWKSVLLKLEKIPLHNVQQKLKISFDGLRNEIEKDLFIDICCSFVGEGRAYVTKILNDCGVDADSGIRVLIECSLITVKKNNKLGMHPLLQEMGREIIREIDEEEFWREWPPGFDDAEYVLTDNTGRRAIERLPVKLRSVRREPSRLLKHTENSDSLSKKLRWISLDWFSSEYLPDEFYLHEAIAIDLKHSDLRFVLKEPQVLANSESCDVSLPSDNLPYWLAYMGEGNSVSFTVPWDRDMKGMALSVVYLSTPEIVATECLTGVLIVNYTKCTLQIHNYDTITSFNDIDWQCIMSNLGPKDKVEIFVTFGDELVVKNTILYLICGESNYLKKEIESKKNCLLRFITKIVMCDFW
ncbi:TMV resistance protein N-like isoform X2 [Vigna unguiculata]|uniref:TMV resistance protein N-like isoform X2 n=1 Tax=Vigna unguiculata TaxID=3917 RepID=UPI001017097E|nr:TMV resistance protein N-like isoform X2 [Vigna unguiculata]